MKKRGISFGPARNSTKPAVKTIVRKQGCFSLVADASAF